MKPTNVSCPKCRAVAQAHCASPTCNWFRCLRCRAYGAYQALSEAAWQDYASQLPLELLYEMASLEEDQYDPPRPVTAGD